MRVAVIGCGYVGLVSAAGLASIGHQVVGVESDPERLAQLRRARAPFHEPSLADLLAEGTASGRLRFSADLDEAATAEVIFLAVQTPPNPDGSNNLAFLRAASEALAGRLLAAGCDHPQVVVVRSTVVPGTTDEMITPLFSRTGTDRIAVAFNPEFLREGSAIADFLQPDRVVVGTHQPGAAQQLRHLYAPLCAPFVHTVPASAELTKYASNALLATLVSFSNEIARIGEAIPGVDAEDVLAAVRLDRRFQPTNADGERVVPGVLSYLKAGCGFGGSCLPKDVSALIAHAHRLGVEPTLLEAVRGINVEQPSRVVQLAAQRLGGLRGRAVAVLGVAFKDGTDDLRDSPGLEIIRLLQAEGARVVAYDPLVAPLALAASNPALEAAASLDEAVRLADAVVVASAAPELGRLVALVADSARPPLVIDGRRHLPADAFPAERFAAVGRGARSPHPVDVKAAS